MVAIDESECSHYALKWALENLHDSISQPLIIFTVQPPINFGYVYAASYGSAPTELIQSIQEQQQWISLALLRRAKEICAQHGVAAETITQAGDPKDAICEAAQKHNIELLILGNRGRGVLQRLVAILFWCSMFIAFNKVEVKKQGSVFYVHCMNWSPVPVNGSWK